MLCGLRSWKGLHSEPRLGACLCSCSGEGYPSRLPCAGSGGPSFVRQFGSVAQCLTRFCVPRIGVTRSSCNIADGLAPDHHRTHGLDAHHTPCMTLPSSSSLSCCLLHCEHFPPRSAPRSSASLSRNQTSFR